MYQIGGYTMSQTTNVLSQDAITVSSTLSLFHAFGKLEIKTAAAKKAAIDSAVSYMQAAKMSYADEQVFKTGCVAAWAGKGATPERLKTCRDGLNIALKLRPDYVAAIAATPKAQEMAKKRGGSKKAATKKASGKVAAIAKVVKGKSQSAPQVDAPVDNIRFDHILQDVTRSVQGIHAHVQMHLKPSQLTDYNKAQTDFLIAVAAIVNK
jgi:hypothetical protein